jgi:hypothetical protein
MKRGQITLFIIVGIVLLLAVGLGVAAWKFLTIERPPEDKIIQDTNTELQPLNSLVEQCLQSTGTQVFKEIGLHGGYYNPEAAGYVAIPGRPTQGRAFEPFPGQVVPYWSHMSSPDSCTDCTLATEQPPLEGSAFPAIEVQAENAIRTETLRCINQFAGLENRYTITPKAEPTVNVLFTERTVVVRLTYPLEVQTAAQSVTTLRDFSTTLNIPFKTIYNEASLIRETSDYNRYFEALTLDAVTLASLGTPEPIPPPFGGTEFSYDPGPFWTLPDVRRTVADTLEQHITLVQLLGSRDMTFMDTGDFAADNQYMNFYFSIDQPPADIAATFVYFSSWEPYVSVHPGSQIIRPMLIDGGLPFITPLKQKSFQYDVSYPILIQLRAPAGKDEYLFQFPVEVNMRNNNPLPAEEIIVASGDLSFCDPGNAVGTTVNVTVTDTDGKLLDASISYSCVVNQCSLGSTTRGLLREQLPVCIGGELQAEREGYKGAAVAFDSLEGEDKATLVLQRLQPVTVEPQIQFIQKDVQSSALGNLRTEWKLSSATHAVDIPYEALILFTPVDDASYTQVVRFPSDAAMIKLYPGTYDVTGIVLQTLDEPHIIPKDRICAGGVAGIGEQCTDIPEIALGSNTYTDENGVVQTIDTNAKGSFYVGGLQRDETTKRVEITQEMLDDGALVVPLATIYLPDVTKHNDLSVFDLIGNFSEEIPIE